MAVSLVGRYEIGDHFEFRSLGSEHIYFSVFIDILGGVYVDVSCKI